ncbi:MAG: hypothetical protein M1820_006326 [Bogoriella megaspora]|nr:MAG: hypothetical protein M1820_006326 [Bogoriella megaspora]
MTVLTLLCVYLLGGITFLPLLLACCLLPKYLRPPETRSIERCREPWVERVTRNSAKSRVPDGVKEGNPQSKNDDHPTADVAAAYFAVCREFDPSAANGKPVEKPTPSGPSLASESPSVYKSMYRSVFERGKTSTPKLDSEQINGRALRNPRKIFYVVLRHRHLMLYDDQEELEVRHVIFLAHYHVDCYAGGEDIPEGDLFIKRNALRLTRIKRDEGLPADFRPYYLFSNNTSEKEDFFHALVQNQDAEGYLPRPLQFENDHMVKLIQQLHGSGESLQTKWFNALLGRMFLALYRTQGAQSRIRSKISRKIARVPKPSFIESVGVGAVNLGTRAPIFTNPKVREMSLDGDLTIEADVAYYGGFGLEIAATARIDLGTRFRARSINLVLSGTLRELSGHVLFRFKPPPSNRIWMTFETMPKMSLSVEPVVSSRQITYGMITRAIESRIREIVKDTVVVPNWDDVPFSDSMDQLVRGGLWDAPEEVRTEKPVRNDQPESECSGNGGMNAMPFKQNSVGEAFRSGDSRDGSAPSLISSSDSAISAESTYENVQISEESLKLKASSSIPLNHPQDPSAKSQPELSVDIDPKMLSEDSAVLTQDVVSIQRPEQEADLSPPSPSEHPAGRQSIPSARQSRTPNGNLNSGRSTSAVSDRSPSLVNNSSQLSISSAQTQTDDSISEGRLQQDLTANGTQVADAPDQSWKKKPSIGSLAAATKKWSWNVGTGANKQKNVASVTFGTESTPDVAEPIGRGRPLPPPGVPLPGPAKESWTAPSLGLGKRKPVPSSKATVVQSPRTASTLENTSSRGILVSSIDLQEETSAMPDSPRLLARAVHGVDSLSDERQSAALS